VVKATVDTGNAAYTSSTYTPTRLVIDSAQTVPAALICR
jgi:hypothetical protein